MKKKLTVKQQTEQLQLIEDRTVEASLRRLRLELAKIRFKDHLEKTSRPMEKAIGKTDRQRKKELQQIERFVQAGNVEILRPGKVCGNAKL